MAEVKKTTKSAEKQEPKKTAPKKTTVAKAETAKTAVKTAEKKAPAKTTSKKAETASKVASEKKAPAKTASKKPTSSEKPLKAEIENVNVEAKKEVKAVKPKTEKKVSGPMLKIKLVKSASGRLVKQQRTLVALGLNKLNSETVKPDNAQTRGMIFVVKHLVTVESVKEK